MPGHQIQTGDQFGDRVLHLQAGVHFQEEEIAFRRQQKFYGAGPHIVAGLGGIDRRLAHLLTQGLVHGRGGCLFHHFLVAALY